MATHRIDIDDEVFAELERHVKGFERPNDVLRRLILTTPTSPTPPRPGKLDALIANDLIKPGDILTHRQPRKHRSFTATVEDHGWIKTDQGLYDNPSRPLGDLLRGPDYQIDGWKNWTHEPSGKTLDALRDALLMPRGTSPLEEGIRQGAM